MSVLYDPNKPLTLAQIQADPQLHAQLLELGRKRFTASSLYVKPWHERWVRFWKIYRSIVDAIDDSDEVNFMIAYAYGVVEDLVSKIAEPILQMRPPCRVAEKQDVHKKQAENFSSIASSYFSTSRYQLEFTESVREQIIIGNAWEFDGWASDYEPARKWAKVTRTTMVDKVRGMAGKLLNVQPWQQPYQSVEEVPYDHPTKVGYYTRFPDAFDIYPEPNVKNVRDMHWLCEQERSVAIDDLKKKTYVDPKDGQRKSLFDFTQMLKDKGAHEPGSIQPVLMDVKNDYGKLVRDAIAGQESETTQYSQLDMDKVSILWVWEQHRVFAIANGSYIVAYKENIFQVPRIPYRLKVYTPQKNFLFGTGAIEPAESQFYELNDIHKLSMRNWVRIINRMVAYDEGRIPHKDDFKPRAGGRIRVRPGAGGSVADAIVSIPTEDVTQSMLAQESNTKGLIERELSVADYSPGVDGTKQTHKTLGGLMEISKNVAQRTTTIRRMILAGYQDQMWFMEKLYSQFAMDKQPFTVYGPDGSTRLAQFDLWDIDTGGMGFDFVIEYDPSFGDDSLLRNQMMVLLDTCIKYENARIQMADGSLPKANMGEVMRRLFRAFGWSDTSGMLAPPDGLMDAQAEFTLMSQGIPCAPNPKENLIEHLIDHTIQLNSPLLQKGLADGTVDPKVGALLKAHIQATVMMISQIASNPQAAAQQKIAAAQQAQAGAGRAPMPGNPGGNPGMTGNLQAGMARAGVPAFNAPSPTPLNSGMPQGV